MPAKSEKQKHLMKMVYAYKKGSLEMHKIPAELAAKIKNIAKSISLKDAKDLSENITFAEWLKILNENVKE